MATRAALARKSPNCKGIDDALCRIILRPFSYAAGQGYTQLGNNYECMPYPGGKYLM